MANDTCQIRAIALCQNCDQQLTVRVGSSVHRGEDVVVMCPKCIGRRELVVMSAGDAGGLTDEIIEQLRAGEEVIRVE